MKRLVVLTIAVAILMATSCFAESKATWNNLEAPQIAGMEIAPMLNGILIGWERVAVDYLENKTNGYIVSNDKGEEIRRTKRNFIILAIDDLKELGEYIQIRADIPGQLSQNSRPVYIDEVLQYVEEVQGIEVLKKGRKSPICLPTNTTYYCPTIGSYGYDYDYGGSKESSSVVGMNSYWVTGYKALNDVGYDYHKVFDYSSSPRKIQYPFDNDPNVKLGIISMDQRWAIDSNLNTNEMWNMDKGMPALAIQSGFVRSITFWTSTGVLVQANSVDECGYVNFQHYVHLSATDMRIRLGDYVFAGSRIGTISIQDAKSEHLHVATLKLTNLVKVSSTYYTGKLSRKLVNFTTRGLTFNCQSINLKKGCSVKPANFTALVATGNNIESFNLVTADRCPDNLSGRYWCTYWKSLNTSIAKVDTYGKITGVAVGTTKIQCLFGGKWGEITVNVTL